MFSKADKTDTFLATRIILFMPALLNYGSASVVDIYVYDNPHTLRLDRSNYYVWFVETYRQQAIYVYFNRP